MHIVSALLFGISANIDSFVLGFSYGVKKQQIPFLTNTIISLITFLGTLISIGLGTKAAAFLPGDTARFGGSILLILLGSYYCLKYLFEKIRQKGLYSVSLNAQSKIRLSKKEAATIGLALTVNNAGMGIGASFAGIHFLLTSLITLFFCGFFLFTGNRMGNRWTPGVIGRYADLLSGCIIILLGIYELIL